MGELEAEMKLPEIVQHNEAMAKLIGQRVKIIISGSCWIWMVGKLQSQGGGWNKDNWPCFIYQVYHVHEHACRFTSNEIVRVIPELREVYIKI